MDYVVDASVIIKCFVPEEESEKAQALKNLCVKGEIGLYSPRYAIVEVANALTLHPFVKLPQDDIIDAISASEEIITVTDLTREEWKTAINLARKIPTSVYDSAYLALALNMDLKFVTADSKLYERLPNSLKPHVVLLKDLKTSS